MAGKLDIGPRIGIEGEAEYKKQMSDIIQQTKTLNSEMKLVTSTFNSETTAEEKAAAQSKVLEKQKEALQQKQKLLNDQYEKAVKLYGENDSKTLKLKESMNKTAAEINNVDKQMDELAKSSDDVGDSLKETEKKSSTFKDVLKANLATEVIKKGFEGLKNAISALANGIADGVKSIAGAMNEAGAAGDEIDKQSQKIQVSAEQYQKLAFAAERSGASIANIETANKSLQKSDFSGNIYDAILAVSQLTDADERAAKASELFGAKAGQELLPLLNAGGEGVQALFDEVESLGGVMSNEAVAAAAAYEDSLTNLQTAFGGLKNNLASEFLPSITTVMDGFTMILSGKTDDGIDTIKNGIEDFEKEAKELGPIAEDMLYLFVDTVVELLPEVLDTAGDIIITLCDGILKMAPELAPVAVDVINKIVNFLVDNFDLIIGTAGDIIITLARGLVDNIPKLAARLPEIGNAILNGLGKIIKDVPEIGKNLIEGLWNGISNAKDWILSKIKGFGSSILGGLKDFFGIHSPSTVMEREIGDNLGLGLVNGYVKTMKKGARQITNATRGAFDGIGDINGDIAVKRYAFTASETSGGGMSYNYGDINVQINAAPGMDAQEVADYVIESITTQIQRTGAFAR